MKVTIRELAQIILTALDGLTAGEALAVLGYVASEVRTIADKTIVTYQKQKGERA